jgi:hypothetical protein
MGVQIYHESTRNRSNYAELNLLRSVLASGVAEALGEGISTGETSKMELRRRQIQAQRWMESNEVYCSPEHGFSFCFLCEALSLDAEDTIDL